MAQDSFTNKEMLIRVLDNIDKMDTKLDVMDIKINNTQSLAANTNGKVKIHTKIIYSLWGTIISVIGWIFMIIRGIL